MEAVALPPHVPQQHYSQPHAVVSQQQQQQQQVLQKSPSPGIFQLPFALRNTHLARDVAGGDATRPVIYDEATGE
jgi:hypothetical protein